MPLQEYVDKEVHLRSIRKKPTREPDELLEWFCNSLGVVGPRDVENICFRIFAELLEAVRKDAALTSDEIADTVGLTRGAVIHHLNRMQTAGLVIKRQGRYEIRTYSLETLVEEIEKDVDRIFGDLRKIAKKLDEKMLK